MLNLSLSYFIAGMGMIPQFFGGWGLILAVVLLVVWLFKVKGSFQSIFTNPKNRRVSLIFLVPALLLFAGGFYVHVIWDRYADRSEYDEDGLPILSEDEYREVFGSNQPQLPHLANLYIANYSRDTGKVMFGEETHMLLPNFQDMIEVRCEANTTRLQAWLGTSVVIDTQIQRGQYIGNLSDDATVIAQQVGYATGREAASLDLRLTSVSIAKPGIERFFDDSMEMEVFGFDQSPPATIYMDEGSTAKFKWDVNVVTQMDLLLQQAKKEREAKELKDRQDP